MNNIGLTGENSIMEGKSWEEARIKPTKEQAKSEQKRKNN